jgi:myosin-5
VPDETHVWLAAEVIREENSGDGKVRKIYAKVELPPSPDAPVDDATPEYEERMIDMNDKQIKALMNVHQLESLPYQNENTGEYGIEDMITLNYLHEAAILFNVKTRFQRVCRTRTQAISVSR